MHAVPPGPDRLPVLSNLLASCFVANPSVSLLLRSLMALCFHRWRLLPALLLLTVTSPAHAAAIAAQSAVGWVTRASTTIGPMRMLEADAYLYEAPTGGMIVRLGSQFTGVDVQTSSGLRPELLSRKNFALALGGEHAKLLLIADQVDVSPSFSGGSNSLQLAKKTSGLVGLPLTFGENIVVHPALEYAGTREEGAAQVTQTVGLLRLRIYGFHLQLGRSFDAPGVGSVISAYSPLEFLQAVRPATAGALQRRIGTPELLLERYDKGGSPYSLNPATTIAGNDYGVRWTLPPMAAATLSAEATMGNHNGATSWKRAETHLSIVLPLLDHRLVGGLTSHSPLKSLIPLMPIVSEALGIWSPGATVLTLTGKAFAMNMDDQARVGFIARARLSSFSNNKRLNEAGRGAMNEVSLWYEGEQAERVHFYFDFVMSRNDLYSLHALPIPDVTTFGVFFGSEDLDLDPSYPQHARTEHATLNHYLDADPYYAPAATEPPPTQPDADAGHPDDAGSEDR